MISKNAIAEAINQFIREMDSMESRMSLVYEVIGFEGRLIEIYDTLVDIPLNVLESVIGDEDNIISWFIYDNQRGAEGMTYKGTELANVDDLVDHLNTVYNLGLEWLKDD